MSHPRHHYEGRQRLKATNNNGEYNRRRLLSLIQDGHWFTVREASQALNLKQITVRRYVRELKGKGLLTEQRRKIDIGKPPYEYSYKDNWHEVLESNHPEVQKHVKRLKHLATIYRQGQMPAVDSIDTALSDIGDEILKLDELRDLLARIYENPDLRNKNLFVKRMS